MYCCLPRRKSDQMFVLPWDLGSSINFWQAEVTSQNGWGWQGPLGLSGPTSVPVRTSRAGCPVPCPGSFWRSPRRRLHSLSGQRVWVLGGLPSSLEIVPGAQGKWEEVTVKVTSVVWTCFLGNLQGVMFPPSPVPRTRGTVLVHIPLTLRNDPCTTGLSALSLMC